jgi:DNA polymerase elongation subunit (family B)
MLLYIEADDKMEARKHYYELTYDNQLITRGIDTRRHDSPAFIKEFQITLLSKLFDCNNYEEVLTRERHQICKIRIMKMIERVMSH